MIWNPFTICLIGKKIIKISAKYWVSSCKAQKWIWANQMTWQSEWEWNCKNWEMTLVETYCMVLTQAEWNSSKWKKWIPKWIPCLLTLWSCSTQSSTRAVATRWFTQGIGWLSWTNTSSSYNWWTEKKQLQSDLRINWESVKMNLLYLLKY